MAKDQHLINDKASIEKVRGMLESQQDENMLLALQLMEGGGVPTQLFAHLFVLCYFYDKNDEVSTGAQQLLHKVDHPALWECMRHQDTHSSPINFYIDEPYDEVVEFLTNIASYKVIDVPTLANLLLQFRGVSAKYCLHHQTAPVADILHWYIAHMDHFLSLRNFELKELPKEVGLLTEIYGIDMSGNHFTEVPDSLANLTLIESLNFESTPLSETAIEKLEKFFPNAMADHYASISYQKFDEEKFQESIEHLQKSLQLMPENPSYMNSLGISFLCNKDFDLALNHFEKSIDCGLPKAYGLYNQACTYSQKKDKPLMLKFLEEAINTDAHFKQRAIDDPDFEAFKTDKDFLAIVEEKK